MAKRDMAALAARTSSAARLDNVTRPPALAGMLRVGGATLPNARLLPLDQVDPNPQQARQHFDESALAELTASVRAHGVLEPILVRPVGDTDRFEILAGERRYRAARAADCPTIPALIHYDLDDGAAQVITALENLQREDLLPGDEARQYARLLTALGISQRELGRRLGMDNKRIGRLLTILDQAPALFDQIDTGELSVNAALGQLDSGYYRDTNLFRMGTELQAGSNEEHDPLFRMGTNSQAGSSITLSAQDGTRTLTPEDFPATVVEPRVSRLELLDPAKADQVARAFKPAAHFTNYVARLQPADVAPPDRVPLAERLELAAREASLLARALRQAAGEEA